MSLEGVFKAAGRSEFYRDRMRRNLSEIPLLTKKDISENGPPKKGRMLTGKMRGAYVFSSGGTTSAPTYSVYTHKEFDRSTQFLAMDLGEVIDKDCTVANLFTPGNLWTAHYAVDRALNRIGCNILPLGGGAPFSTIVEVMREFEANVVIGCPSTLLSIATSIRDPLEVEEVIYGGEFLYKGAEETLRETFGAKNFFSFYGPVESGYVGMQKRSFRSTVHRIAEEYHLVEILGDDLRETKKGRIVLTNLNRELMPIIRFDTGDLGKCAGEGKIELLGRMGETMKIGGAWISYDTIEKTIKGMCSPTAVQVKVAAAGPVEKLEILVETRDEVSEDKLLENVVRGLKQEADAFIGDFISKGSLRIRVKILKPGMIERVEKTGKIRRVVDLRSHL